MRFSAIIGVPRTYVMRNFPSTPVQLAARQRKVEKEKETVVR